MAHFNQEFIKFFIELSQNNHKKWFDENRKTYEKEVKKPFSEFVGKMILNINEHEPGVQIRPSDAIMRINRDIRFSKDKTLYNTHVSAIISATGKKDKSYPGLYFRLSPEGIDVYGGAYMLDTATLKRVREFIANHLKNFSTTYNDKEFQTKYGQIEGEKHKRIPTEFKDIAEKEPLILNKQFYYSAHLESELITSDKLDKTLMEYYIAGKKVNEFLKKAIK